MQVKANDILIEVEDFGRETDPAILLIMGYTAQLIYWPMALVDGLVAAGFRVIRYDNRDVGMSHKCDGEKAPHPIRQLISKRFFPKRKIAPYSLADMAADAVGVLDALNIRKAHIVGASMGGMIGQLVAGHHPDRTLSFTPIMSSTNGPGLPGADAAVRKILLKSARTKLANPAEALALGLAFSALIASEEGRARVAERKLLMEEAQQRGYYPAGPKRQMAAIIETGNLRPIAQTIAAPTLVIHGLQDPLIPHACGADIAAHITDSRLQLIDGMGHDLPPSKLPQIVDLIARHCAAV